VGDWVRDIQAENVEYVYLTGLFCEIHVFSNERRMATFYVETYEYDYFDELRQTGVRRHYDTLPDEYLQLEIWRIGRVYFEGMGIPYNIRGIQHGTHADDVKAAFLNMSRDKAFIEDSDAWYIQELYATRDVDPLAEYEAWHDEEGVHFIHGMDFRFNRDDEFENIPLRYSHYQPFYPDNSIRLIVYSHTEPYNENIYTIHNNRSIITFEIDDNGNVAGFYYTDITHLN
jgi:hypothetical protein